MLFSMENNLAMFATFKSSYFLVSNMIVAVMITSPGKRTYFLTGWELYQGSWLDKNNKVGVFRNFSWTTNQYQPELCENKQNYF